MNASVSTGSNVTFTWDFGDSTDGNGASPTHTYPAAGIYTAEVTASNLVSQLTVTTEILVEEAILGLAADNDGPTLLGTATQLSTNVTGGSNVIYEWDFGDSTSGSGASPTHSYPATGEYTAEVTASNAVSQAKTTTLVQVEEGITGLAAANDGPTLLGNLTQFTASLSTGSNVTYEWDFGDGDGESGSAVAHQYASQGIYTVELTATNLVSQETATMLVYITEQFDWIYMPLQATHP